MQLENHINQEHNGDRDAFVRSYNEELQTDDVLKGAKHFTVKDVDRWIAKGWKWVKGRVAR